MEQILKMLITNKGTRSYRTALFIAVAFVAWKQNEMDKRMSVIEYQLLQHHANAFAPDPNIGSTP